MMVEFINNWKPTITVGDFGYYDFSFIEAAFNRWDTGWQFRVSLMGLAVRVYFPRKSVA